MFSLKKNFKDYSLKDFRIIFKGKEEICENTIAFYFDTEQSGYSFEEGQYAVFTLVNPVKHDLKGNSRPFSFANSPHVKNTVMISARINSSVFVSNLSSLATGSEIFVSKPSGNLRKHVEKAGIPVFIAGGIGITPVRSIVENMIHRGITKKFFLFYLNKSESMTAFFDDFKKWSDVNKNFIFIPVIEDKHNINWKYESGKADKKLLLKYLSDTLSCNYFLSGSSEMIESFKKILFSVNVPEKNIKTDNYS